MRGRVRGNAGGLPCRFSPSGTRGRFRATVAGFGVIVAAMKNTASSPNATTQQQNKDSRQNSGAGAAAQGKSATNAASASQRADGPAKRGEPGTAKNKSDRSPKQENL